MTLAVTDRWRDRDGQAHEKVDYIACTVWGKFAETCHQYLKKGRLVCLQGKLTMHKYTLSTGQERECTEVSCNNVQFLESAPPAQKADVSQEDLRPPPLDDADIPY